MRKLWWIAIAGLMAVVLATSVSPAWAQEEEAALPEDAVVELLPPGAATQELPFASVSFEDVLPGWRLTLDLPDQQLLDSAVNEQIAAYLWTGILVIALIVFVVVVIARSVGRQMKYDP